MNLRKIHVELKATVNTGRYENVSATFSAWADIDARPVVYSPSVYAVGRDGQAEARVQWVPCEDTTEAWAELRREVREQLLDQVLQIKAAKDSTAHDVVKYLASLDRELPAVVPVMQGQDTRAVYVRMGPEDYEDWARNHAEQGGIE